MIETRLSALDKLISEIDYELLHPVYFVSVLYPDAGENKRKELKDRRFQLMAEKAKLEDMEYIIKNTNNQSKENAKNLLNESDLIKLDSNNQALKI